MKDYLEFVIDSFPREVASETMDASGISLILYPTFSLFEDSYFNFL
jgi:hypothetical protein